MTSGSFLLVTQTMLRRNIYTSGRRWIIRKIERKAENCYGSATNVSEIHALCHKSFRNANETGSAARCAKLCIRQNKDEPRKRVRVGLGRATPPPHHHLSGKDHHELPYAKPFRVYAFSRHEPVRGPDSCTCPDGSAGGDRAPRAGSRAPGAGAGPEERLHSKARTKQLPSMSVCQQLSARAVLMRNVVQSSRLSITPSGMRFRRRHVH